MSNTVASGVRAAQEFKASDKLLRTLVLESGRDGMASQETLSAARAHLGLPSMRARTPILDAWLAALLPDPLNLSASEYAALAVGTVTACAFGAVAGEAIGESMMDKKALGATSPDPYTNPRYNSERRGDGHYGYRPATDRQGGARKV
jgi:hypothetical protein